MAIKLGSKVRDKISGFEGTATCRSEFLHGCVRICITPNALHDGKPIDAHWFDEPQIEVLEESPVGEPVAPRHGDRPDHKAKSDANR